jgi:hypothetical protein
MKELDYVSKELFDWCSPLFNKIYSKYNLFFEVEYVFEISGTENEYMSLKNGKRVEYDKNTCVIVSSSKRICNTIIDGIAKASKVKENYAPEPTTIYILSKYILIHDIIKSIAKIHFDEDSYMDVCNILTKSIDHDLVCMMNICNSAYYLGIDDIFTEPKYKRNYYFNKTYIQCFSDVYFQSFPTIYIKYKGKKICVKKDNKLVTDVNVVLNPVVDTVVESGTEIELTLKED